MPTWPQYLHNSLDLGYFHLEETSTCPFIVATLRNGISQWSTGGPVQWQGPTPALDDSIGQVIFTAFQEQQSIGWEQAI